ncbi:hypothetical protein [Actinocrispum wychmicini]|uniref:Uncharacterized protein n=1 Tax=Actinocrispum wychmicini TaxID=1213861 RepID=A0A4R2J8U9_9PSEU|nr:hypothetical protein [Actinocrispum wychmicini]TCO52978.1 hypothetical protein EV192_111172 [Actinocrispum wychmicini]
MTSLEFDQGPVVTAQEVMVTGTTPTRIRIYTAPGNVPVIEITGGDGRVYRIQAPAETMSIGKTDADGPLLEFTADLHNDEEGIWLTDPVSSMGVAFRQANGFWYTHANFVFESAHALPLQNGWTNWGDPYAPLTARLLPHGFVHLEGTVKPGTRADFTTIATLPEGYRPVSATRRVSMTDNGIAMFADVQPDGQVRVVNVGPAVSVSFCADIPVTE